MTLTDKTTLKSEEKRAAIFAKLISPEVANPSYEQITSMPKPWAALFYTVLGEPPEKRGGRLRMELMARENGPYFWDLVQAADPSMDLDAVEVEDAEGWEFLGFGDAYQDLPPIEWAVEGILPRPGIGILYGKPKSLKSLLALDMAVCVAAGLPWLDPLPDKGGEGYQTMPLPVVWLDFENGRRLSLGRLGAFGQARDISEQTPFFLASMPRPWLAMDETDHVSKLIDRLEALGAGLLVVDHLGAVLGGADENSPEISTVMSNFRLIAEACDLSIVLIHHQVKGWSRKRGGAADTLRGHGSILANCDLAALILRDENESGRVEIIPAAVRGPEIDKQGAIWSYEHKPGTLELGAARFWGDRIVTVAERTNKAVLDALKENPGVNQTALRAAVNRALPNIGDPTVRAAISRLERSGAIFWQEGPKNSKIYYLAAEG